MLKSVTRDDISHVILPPCSHRPYEANFDGDERKITPPATIVGDEKRTKHDTSSSFSACPPEFFGPDNRNSLVTHSDAGVNPTIPDPSQGGLGVYPDQREEKQVEKKAISRDARANVDLCALVDGFVSRSQLDLFYSEIQHLRTAILSWFPDTIVVLYGSLALGTFSSGDRIELDVQFASDPLALFRCLESDLRVSQFHATTIRRGVGCAQLVWNAIMPCSFTCSFREMDSTSPLHAPRAVTSRLASITQGHPEWLCAIRYVKFWAKQRRLADVSELAWTVMVIHVAQMSAIEIHAAELIRNFFRIYHLMEWEASVITCLPPKDLHHSGRESISTSARDEVKPDLKGEMRRSNSPMVVLAPLCGVTFVRSESTIPNLTAHITGDGLRNLRREFERATKLCVIANSLIPWRTILRRKCFFRHHRHYVQIQLLHKSVDTTFAVARYADRIDELLPTLVDNLRAAASMDRLSTVPTHKQYCAKVDGVVVDDACSSLDDCARTTWSIGFLEDYPSQDRLPDIFLAFHAALTVAIPLESSSRHWDTTVSYDYVGRSSTKESRVPTSDTP